jgi:Cytidylate kinase-like family
MAPPPVVTLFEKYGAGARYIGPWVAEALGVAWLDQAFSSADIESAKYPGAGAPSEAGSGLARFLGRYAPSATVLDDASIPLAQAQDAEMVEENTRLVKQAAETGTVMLGRNGALIIGDIPNALHVLLDAPVDVRIAAPRARRESTWLTPRGGSATKDRIRAEMSERFYYWIDRYHIALNTGMLGLDPCVEVIVAAYRAKVAHLAPPARES